MAVSFDERACFTPKQETKTQPLTCPLCKHQADYQIKWTHYTKKDRIPGGAQDPGDKSKFEKLRDYLFRIDDYVNCARCRRRFEIPAQKNIIFL